MIERESPKPASEMIADALAAAGDAAYEWDLRTDKLQWRTEAGSLSQFGDITNITTGSALSARMTADDLMLRQQALENHFSTHAPMDCEYGIRRSDGQFSWVHDRGGAQFENGRPVRLLGVLRLIDQRKARDVKLGMSASYDLISGQHSAEALQDYLANKIATALRSKMSGAFLYVGIDYMSEVNIRHGQEIADRILFEVGERIQRSLRGGDVMGRINGDRFGIVLSNCTATELSLAAERFLNVVQNTPFLIPGHGDVTITVSIGGCNFPDFVRTVPDAMNVAEDAMRKAKDAGRNRFVAHQADEAERLTMKRADEVGQRIIQAVRNNNVLFAFQPISETMTSKVIYYEALLRIRGADGAIHGAGEFIPDLERGGRMYLLDQRILEMGVEELRQYPNVRLAINLSGLTACEPDWIRRAEALLRYSPDIASRLTVEITETAALRNITACARTIDALKDLGCEVALDDFGVANITYRELRALSVHKVKIDASLVRNLYQNPVNHGAIAQLVRIAKEYSVATVAEGIEDVRDLQVLQKLGVDYVQGFLLGQPSMERPWLEAEADKIIPFTRPA
jgi:diguanylate cyclase (GGDEF)-like protein